MGRRRVLAIAAVALVAVGVVVAIALPEIVRRVVVWRVAALTGRPVTLAALELSLVGGRLALRDLRVMDRDQEPLATIQALQVRFSPRDLLRGHVRVIDGTLQAPTVRIVRTGPSAFNISDLLGRQTEGGMAVAVTLERFALRDGAVALEDRTLASPRVWRVEALTLEATGVSTRPATPAGVVTLSAVAAGAPISVWVAGVRLSPLRFNATAIARGIDGSLAALYLPPDSPLSPTRATLDATATIEQDAGATRAALDAVFSGVDLRGPGQAGTAVSAPAIRVTVRDLRVSPGGIELGELTVDGGRVALEDARLAPIRRWQAEGIAVEARNLSSARAAPAGVASARAVVAGSPVSVWVAGIRLAPLELNATAIIRNVDFALFRLYVPPGLPVQPERGVVNATVRVEHDARAGTRLALDVGLTSVELRRPAHFVTAPSLRVTAEDITFGAGVVTVGRAALAGDRLMLEDRTLSPPRTWPVQNLIVEASRLSSRREDVQGVASARATLAGAAASAWVTHVRLAPLELNLTAILRDLDLRLVELYLPPAAPVLLERGVANASVQLGHEATAGTRLAGDVTLTGVQARGRGVATGLALSAPSLRVALADGRWHENTLGVGRLEASGSGVVTDARAASARLDIERFRLATERVTWPVSGPAPVALSARLRDGGELEADGTVFLTAPPPMVAWTSELTLRLKDLAVTPVSAYVPGASGLSGRISAALTATTAYGAGLTARVRGEASAARLALAEGSRTLVSVRGLDATGLDVQWPEQVAVGRLRVDRPRALIERDRQGVFALAARFAPPPTQTAPAASTETAPAGPSSAPDIPRPRPPALAAGEIVVERGRLAFVDARDGVPVRLEVPRIDLTLRDARWPGSAPAQLRLDATLPEGGTLGLEGAVSAEPTTVDVTVMLTDASLAPLQPHLPFRAGVSGRLDATLAVAGPLAPAPRLAVRGDATIRSAALTDGTRPVITLDRFSARGIDATLPSRFTAERIGVRRSWALLERDREGRFNLEALLRRAPGAPSARPEPPGGPAPPAPETARLELRVGEGTVEEGAATIVDGITTPAARFEIAGARLAVQDLAWPPSGPVKLQVSSPMPTGGRLDVDGTLELEPVRLNLNAKLEAVELAPGQPYLPIEARVAGRVTGDLTVKLELEPLGVQVAGQAQLQGFRLAEGDRPLITASRAEALGIDVDWPRRVALERLLLRRPRLLIERNPQGEVTLPRLLTPRRAEPGAASAPAPAPNSSTPPAGTAPPTIEIGQVTLERGSGRFVDQTFTPPYAEELSRVDLTVANLTTAAGRRARFTGGGTLGGGGSFKLEGEAAREEPPVVDLKIDINDFALPRGNPYLERYTGWLATRGALSASASYALAGTRLEARHDVLVRRLEVERSGGNDQVEQRLGLPLGFLVSLLKDARGEIRLSVPVSGDLSTREFDFQDAVWSGVRALSFRLLALPFSRVGSLAFTEDSKVEAVTLAPIVVEPGTARLAPGMTEHLDRVAAFLRGAPAVNVRLAPILVQADLDALKRERPDAPSLPGDAMKELGARRLETVRQALTARGVEPGRLAGSARRVALVEAAGAPRVELDIRP